MSDLDPSLSLSRHPEPKQTATQTKESASQYPQENMFPSWCVRYGTVKLIHYTSICIFLRKGLARDSVGLPQEKKVTGMDMMKVLRCDLDIRRTKWICFQAMTSYIWPEDNPKIRRTVLASLGILVSAKVLNTGVPFIFRSGLTITDQSYS